MNKEAFYNMFGDYLYQKTGDHEYKDICNIYIIVKVYSKNINI